MNTRRSFIASLAAPGMLLGVAPAAQPRAVHPAPALDGLADDATLFTAARKHFLIPPGVAYCNTGTLGASPREVVDALTDGIRRLETDLASWPYEQPDGEPLTGYQQLADVRAAVGRFVGATAAEIALTQNATMGMNFLANGLDLAAGDEVLTTDQEHGGGISPWRLLAKRRGFVPDSVPPAEVARLFGREVPPGAGDARAVVEVYTASAFGGVEPGPEERRELRERIRRLKKLA